MQSELQAQGRGLAPNLVDEEEISLQEYFHTLWLRRRLFFSIVITLLAISLIVVFQITPRYAATASLIVGGSQNNVVDIDAVLTGDLGNDSAIRSEVEVLRSRGLAHRVVDKLNLVDREEFNPDLRVDGLLSYFNPANWIPDSWLEHFTAGEVDLTEEEKEEKKITRAVDVFLERLDINHLIRSKVIQITFQSEDRKLSAHIANVMADQYIIGQLEAKFDATEKATKWLNKQIGDLRTKVEESERLVEMFREKHGITQGKVGVIVDEQLSELNSQLIILKAERAEAEARLGQIQRVVSNQSVDVDSASEVLSSTLIQRLREQETEVLRKESEFGAEYGPKHPKMIQVKAEIRDLRNKIRDEIRKISIGLKNEVEIARTRERSLIKSLQGIESKSGSQKKEEVQLRALQREADANRALFEMFLSRFKETTSTQGMQEADARIISMAEVPLQSAYPRKKIVLGICFVFALIAGVVVVFLVEALNPGIRSPEQVEQLLGLTAIGVIPLVESSSPYDLLIEKPQSALSEAVNNLRVSIMISDPDNEVKVCQITSSLPGEGKSSVALMVARQAAQSGQKVVLVDCDLRKPTIAKKLGINEDHPGFTDLILSKEKNVAEFLVKDEATGLFVMVKGRSKYNNIVDIVSSQRMHQVVDILRENFDLVIFDTPPVMAVSEARILAQLVDKTIFVVEWDKTPRKVISASIQQISDLKNNLIGVVLQKVNLKKYGRYGYGSDSGYYYHYGRYDKYYSS